MTSFPRQIYGLYCEAFVRFSEAGPIKTLADESRFATLLTQMMQGHAHVSSTLARAVPEVCVCCVLRLCPRCLLVLG